MRIWPLVLCFVGIVLPSWAGQIHLADNEYRQFRSLVLENGLEVLLVHDERAVKSAAALALPVGSLDDPDSQAGLAHFLEHMLFLGSEHYPDPEEYQAFIAAHGGQTNAATGYTSTTYMIELDPAALNEGVRRMADTLAHPRLDPLYVDKERNAVNAEMESKKHSDGLRLAMLMMSTLNPAHPATRFTGGNLETLSDKPGSILHEELVRFHRAWYAAQLIKGVLYGPQSLDELEALARSALAVLPRRDVQVHMPDVPAVTDAEQGIVVSVRPVRETRSLHVEFVLPQEFGNLQTKPLQVISTVLGTETRHSLVEFLRDKGWALGLSVGSDQTSLRNGVSLSVHVELTDTGAAHRDEVLAAIFAYLDLLRQQGVSQERFAQMQRMLDLDFRFAPMVSGFDYVAMTAGTMLHYPVEDAHFGPFRIDFFDAQAVQNALALMTPDQARIFHVGPDQSTDKEAYFFRTPHAVRAISTDDRMRWHRLGADFDLRPPELNPFVPDSLNLAAPDTQAMHKPRVILRQPGIHVWLGQSRYRQEPKAIVLTRVHSPHMAGTVEQAVLQALVVELWSQCQAGLRYQALEAGLGVHVSADEGLLVRVDGFSQHLPELATQTLDFLWQERSEEEFGRAKAELVRSLTNRAKQSLFRQAMSSMQSALIVPSWSDEELVAAAQNLTLEAMHSYLREIRRTAHFSVLGFGNLDAAALRSLGERLSLLAGPGAQGPSTAQRILAVPGLILDYRQPSTLEDSALVELFLDPELDFAAKARMAVLDGLLGSRFFAQLRTQEQLGYVASTFPLMYARGSGLGFGVQSPVQGTSMLQERFSAFYIRALGALRAVSPDEFERVRQGLVAEQARVPDTLDEEFGWLETDFRLGNARFDSRARFVSALRSVTLPEVLRAYERVVLGRSGTRVLIQVQGSRWADQGWATLPGAHVVTRPEHVHALLATQAYHGL